MYQVNQDVTIENDVSKTKWEVIPFHHPHYFLFNLALGAIVIDPSDTEFPHLFEIDYVRVFQKEE